jgi:hypothetical protein
MPCSIRLIRPALLLVALLAGTATLAADRCANGLIENGDSTLQVLKTCGPPSQRQIVPQATRADGVPRWGSVVSEAWTYGPDRGRVMQLRFISDRLVEVRSGRQ